MFRLVAVIACLFVSIDVIEGARAQSPPLPGKEDPVCGAKCLYVILRAFGKAPDSLRKIVAELGPASKNGYSLQQLRECALDHQLFAECVELGKDELGRFCKSNGVIIHLNEAGESTSGHYVLCEGVTESGVTVFDGDGSAREVSNEILDVWTGRTLIVSRNPIDLRAGFQTNQISLLAYAFGAAVLVIGLFVLVKGWRSKWMLASGWLVCFATVVGCQDASAPKEGGNSGSRTASAVLPDASRPPGETGVWIEERVKNVGDIRRGFGRQNVAVKIYNSDNDSVRLESVNYSCSCLMCKFSSLDIPPKSSITCELLLDSTRLGPKKSAVSIVTDRDQHVSMAVTWNVVADLTSDPELISGVSLKSGESATVTVKLKQAEGSDCSNWQVESVIDTRETEKNLVVTPRLEGNTCVVTFAAATDSPGGLVSGRINISTRGDVEPSLGIPFSVYIACDFDLSPVKLFLAEKEGNLCAQLVLTSLDVAGLEPMKLAWKGKEDMSCDYDHEDQNGVRIVNVRVRPDLAATISHLEVSAAGGEFVRRVPVILP